MNNPHANVITYDDINYLYNPLLFIELTQPDTLEWGVAESRARMKKKSFFFQKKNRVCTTVCEYKLMFMAIFLAGAYKIVPQSQAKHIA